MVLHLEDVSLKRNGQWILKDINWNVEKGQNWVIYGLNGAGKTSLLNMLCAYYYPTKGKVNVLGKEFGKTELGGVLRRKIGIVSSGLQQKLYKSDSAFEIILSGAFASIGLYESPTEEIREKAIQLLKELGCLQYADRPYETLSQGERQRVLIGRALMGNPELLILDEPTTGLDYIAKEFLLDTIESISTRRHSPTMLYVTHHIEEILPIFSYTMLLKNGEVFSAGESKKILSGNTLSAFFNLPVEVYWKDGRPLLARSYQKKQTTII